MQAQQEKLYQEYSAEKNKESRDKLEAYYEQLVNKLQSEIKCIFSCHTDDHGLLRVMKFLRLKSVLDLLC